jgi:chromosomal replication initiation ATPase DnaA
MPTEDVGKRFQGFRKAWFIAEEVVYNYGLTLDDLRKSTRTRTLSTCKKEVAHRLRKETNLSWREIGEMLGRKSVPRSKDYGCEH